MERLQKSFLMLPAGLRHYKNFEMRSKAASKRLSVS